MFTVIICDKSAVDDCFYKYYIYLKPLMDKGDFAFCEWDPDGESLDEAVPGLRKTIRGKSRWRAEIIADHNILGEDASQMRNPFNYTNYEKWQGDMTSFSQIIKFRQLRVRSLQRAVQNPLMKLSIWLCGMPINVRPVLCYESFKEEFDNAEGDDYFVLLKKHGVDAAEAETDRARLKQFEALSSMFDAGGELFEPPVSVLAAAERIVERIDETESLIYKDKTEYDYSRFCIDNLYPEKLRYILYDIRYIKKRRSEREYLNALTALLMLAVYDLPEGVFRSNRIYNINLETDYECISELCRKYTDKLYATLSRIEDISLRLEKESEKKLDGDTAKTLFEGEVTVPVEVSGKFDKKSMMAVHDSIGLSKDCPQDEYVYWNVQYQQIKEKFIRYLREPRRAVKTAVKGPFRRLNKNDNEYALRLSEDQREDILIHLQDEEEKMLSSGAVNIFNTKQYRKWMEQEDRAVRRKIGQRMTKKKTVCIGTVAGAVYLFGFIPMLVSDLNSVGIMSFSWIITLLAMMFFMSSSLIYLFVLRHRMKGHIKRFNLTMLQLLHGIQEDLDKTSVYLSRTCDVMRAFSVLNYKENSFEYKKNILNIHRSIIEEKIAEANELFETEPEKPIEKRYDERPFEYDFLKMEEYEYIIPYSGTEKKIEFIQEGNFISVSIDYISSMIAVREEIYD